MSVEVNSRALLRTEPVAGNYFVAAYPPFSAWSSEQNGNFFDVLDDPLERRNPLGAYLHIPFCAKKCDYCYYLSYTGERAATIDAYLSTVLREAELYGERAALGGRPLSYLYFGGGTPSLLTPDQLLFTIEGLRGTFLMEQLEEFSFEVAPRSVRPEFLKALKTAGATRISMGVQSLDDELLKLNGRIHTERDVRRAFGLLKEYSFDYVNLDLMAGLLGETDEQWKRGVQKTIALDPESITIYQTEIPHNTQLYKDYAAGRLPIEPPGWEEKRARLDNAFMELDRAGYHLISAYIAVKGPARHTFLYQDYLWSGADLLALGVASFGYFGGVHYQNQPTLSSYMRSLEAGSLPVARSYALTAHEQLVREFILQLKLGAVDLAKFQRKFGVDARTLFFERLSDLEAEGFMTVTPAKIKLTSEGLLRVDRLLPLFYDAGFQNIRYS